MLPRMTTDAPLRVVRGDPRPDELAAVVTVLDLATGTPAAAAQPEPRPSSWAAYWRGLRQPVRSDTDGWRASGLPK